MYTSLISLWDGTKEGSQTWKQQQTAKWLFAAQWNENTMERFSSMTHMGGVWGSPLGNQVGWTVLVTLGVLQKSPQRQQVEGWLNISTCGWGLHSASWSLSPIKFGGSRRTSGEVSCWAALRHGCQLAGFQVLIGPSSRKWGHFLWCCFRHPLTWASSLQKTTPPCALHKTIHPTSFMCRFIYSICPSFILLGFELEYSGVESHQMECKGINSPKQVEDRWF